MRTVARSYGADQRRCELHGVRSRSWVILVPIASSIQSDNFRYRLSGGIRRDQLRCPLRWISKNPARRPRSISVNRSNGEGPCVSDAQNSASAEQPMNHPRLTGEPGHHEAHRPAAVTLAVVRFIKAGGGWGPPHGTLCPLNGDGAGCSGGIAWRTPVTARGRPRISPSPVDRMPAPRRRPDTAAAEPPGMSSSL